MVEKYQKHNTHQHIPFIITIQLLKTFYCNMKKRSVTMELRENVYRFITDKLVTYGFKRKSTIISRKYNNQIVHEIIIGSTIDKIDKRVCLFFTISVDYVKINKFIEEYLSPVLKVNVSNGLGYLMPQKDYKEWEFVVGEDYTQQATLIVDTIIQYAFPYFDKFSDEATLIETIENDSCILKPMKSYLLPILYYLQKNPIEALSCMNEYVKFYKQNFSTYLDIISKEYSLSTSEINNIKDRDLEIYMTYMDTLKKVMAEGKTLE